MRRRWRRGSTQHSELHLREVALKARLLVAARICRRADVHLPHRGSDRGVKCRICESIRRTICVIKRGAADVRHRARRIRILEACVAKRIVRIARNPPVRERVSLPKVDRECVRRLVVVGALKVDRLPERVRWSSVVRVRQCA